MPVMVTVLDEDREVRVEAEVLGRRVMVPEDVLGEATGWTLKPEGLCRDDVCVPLSGRQVGGAYGGLDLALVADVLGRPVAVETSGEPVVAIGPRTEEAPGELRVGEPAPDFTLETLDGGTVTFSGLAGAKRVLFAWASW